MNPQTTVLLMGGTTLLGRLIGMHLTEVGYRVHTVGLIDAATRLSLGYPNEHYDWDGQSLIPDDALEGVSIVVNVVGTGEPTGLWSRTRRGAIHKARIAATTSAVAAIQRHSKTIKTFVQASSLDYYGNAGTGSDPVDETANEGQGYWAESVGAWERAAATVPATTRLAILRLAPVYSFSGGVLYDKAKSYSFSMGSPGVRKNHWRGWIHEADCVRLVQQIIEDDRWQGPINVTAPTPTTDAEIHRLLSSYYGPMARIPGLGYLARYVLGYDRARDNGNLAAVSAIAQRFGFKYKYLCIADCLGHFLDRKNTNCMFVTVIQWVPTPRDQVWAFFKDSSNWNELNPPSHRLSIKPDSPKLAKEGDVFRFDLTLYNHFRSTCSMRHFNRVKPKSSQFIMQEGIFEVWEQTQTLTEVAGGTRIVEVMRYRWPYGSLFQVFGYYFAMPTYRMIFAHKYKATAKRLGCAQNTAPLRRAS